MKNKLATFILLGAVAAISGCVWPWTRTVTMPPPADDAALVSAVRAAVANKVPPSRVDAAVGVPAILNTSRAGDRTAYAGVSMFIDPQEKSQTASLKGTDVAYWGRMLSSPQPRVVGIVWRSDGSSALFFSIITTP